MLHWSVSVFAAILLHLNPGPVIEIGTYAGGLTCPLGTAAKALGQSLTSFEIGGSFLAHSQIPTTDILGDLRANVAAYGLQDCVSIIPMKVEDGGSDTLSFPKASVRMLVIDADGDVLAKLKAVKDYLAPDCILIVDDFLMTGPARGRKSPRTRAHMYRLISAGLVEEIDVLGWATWFGRIINPEKIGPALSDDGVTARI
nr:class I SAM-dependent methyltransferase [Magnetospirillum sulfuroxidans]